MHGFPPVLRLLIRGSGSSMDTGQKALVGSILQGQRPPSRGRVDATEGRVGHVVPRKHARRRLHDGASLYEGPVGTWTPLKGVGPLYFACPPCIFMYH